MRDNCYIKTIMLFNKLYIIILEIKIISSISSNFFFFLNHKNKVIFLIKIKMSSETDKKEKALALYRRKLLERREIQAKLETRTIFYKAFLILLY